MVGRKKGTPKTGGRKAGTPNKVSPSLRKRYQEYMEESFDEYLEVLKTLKTTSPKDYVRAWNDMANKVIPTLQSISAEVEVEKKSTIEDKLKELASMASQY